SFPTRRSSDLKTSTMQPNNLLVTLIRFHQYFLPLKKMANGCTNLQELVKKSRSHPEKLPFQHLTLQVLKDKTFILEWCAVKEPIYVLWLTILGKPLTQDPI